MPILRPILRPLTSPLTRAMTDGAGGGFNPVSLYGASDLGALFYPAADFASLYQDSAGTTPVTATGQPVGLMLDRRFGLVLGAEIGAPLRKPDWIELSSTIGSSTAFTTPGAGGIYLGVATPGRSYKVSVSWSSTASGVSLYEEASGNVIVNGGSSGSFSGVVLHRNTTGLNRFFYVRNSSAGTTTLTVSIKELPGNHATQPTTTARPLVKQTGSVYRIDFDGVDDKLTTTFPDLGSNVTIARSVPGVGASILTGQTIGAGAWDDSTNHCGLIIINRALTGPETAAVTTYLNQKAGV